MSAHDEPMDQEEEQMDELYQRLIKQQIERKINKLIQKGIAQAGLTETEEQEGEAGTSRPVVLKGSILPRFDPDQKMLTVTSWLQKIDQLGRLHSWTDYEKSCYMQNKLAGTARDWYNRQDDYDKTWTEWKTALTQAFPRHTDFATLLEELVDRRKRQDETMTHYYHGKLALAQQCRLDSEATISCIIRGLPSELQANAHAYQCTTPDELYAGFLAPLDNYESPSTSSAKVPRVAASVPKPRKYFVPPGTSVRCYTCGKSGHISRECPRHTTRCFTCNRKGHISADCYSKKNKSEKSDSTKNVKIVSNSVCVSDVFKKMCEINGTAAVGYIDTGSEINVIAKDVVQKLNVDVEPVKTILKGFGGRAVQCDFVVKFELLIDDITVNTTAVVSEIFLDGIDLIIGQPVLNKEGLSLVVKGGVSCLVDNICNFLQRITITEAEERPKIVLNEDVTVPAGHTQVVSVIITGSGSSGDCSVYQEAKCYPLSVAMVCIPAGVHRGPESQLIISNMGSGGVSLKKGQLLARGEECFEMPTAEEKINLALQDDSLRLIIEQLQSDNKSDLLKDYIWKNNRLYRKTSLGERLVVPKSARWQIMLKYHDQIGHPGLSKCETLIKSKFWFAKMTQFIKKYVSACLDCAYNKGNFGKTEGQLHPIDKHDKPMDTVHIDHVGPFPKSASGFSYILTVIDGFTKYFVVFPCKTVNSRECVKHLRQTFGMFLGYPRRIISDRGTAFTSRSFYDFVNEKQIKHVVNAVSTPRANGQIERFHRTFLNALRPSIDTDTHWDEKIVDIVWGINNTVNASTKHTAFELMFGYKGRLLSNLESEISDTANVTMRREAAAKALDKISKQMKEMYDKKHRVPRKYKKGDLVLWRDGFSCSETGVSRKLDPRYSGPYTVVRALGNDRYEIRSIKGLRGYKKFETVVAADSLRRYCSTPGASSSDTDSSSDNESCVRENDESM
ncbi:hypothetical protein NQ315_005361 [Exocentrus adspersus]|uniref:RNA-directed DNA polymerase n=1 Tax=Exocentrus adspersus TaxID=1586481 RepID=A0AAV8W1B5_9CUCU|nr:hypothetical protein NQ315_005361 [Exocentrus adspersus]